MATLAEHHQAQPVQHVGQTFDGPINARLKQNSSFDKKTWQIGDNQYAMSE